MREDVAGLFWDDTPPPRVLKEVAPPRVPPARTWEDSSYLPGLEEARAFNIPLFTMEELTVAQSSREPLLMDTECYCNYWLIAFRSFVSGKAIYFEMRQGETMDLRLLNWILNSFLLVGFNSDFYDLPLTMLALAGHDCATLKIATNKIIQEQVKPWMVLRSYRVKPLRLDHVDLIQVCPLRASLKLYGGRLHVPKMQDLPFHPETILTEDQITIVRWYCINGDLTNTAFLFRELRQQVELRAQMSQTYGMDLRSKSDSQIAETVINHELTRVTYSKPQRNEVPPGTVFQYQIPGFINYVSDELCEMLEAIRGAQFIVDVNGYTDLPEELKKREIRLGQGVYRMGIGGLHSSETCIAHYSDDLHQIVDRDVASYYPAIILNLNLFPKHIGPAFLEVYRSLVDRRLKAKKEGNKVEADTLKISVNGIFGKTGNKWSTLYAPELTSQITITGQLSLLMLVERLENHGIPVISANTDGVTSRCPRRLLPMMQRVVEEWEIATGFKTEEAQYHALFSRDINNYIAFKSTGGFKVKGDYAERGSAGDSVLSKNPTNLICNDALIAFLGSGKPILETIRECRDIRRFISIRTVNGGAVKEGHYLGKAIRWYYAAGVTGEIIYAVNGHSVPKSEGAKPLMELPAEFPQDVNYDWYEQETLSMLKEVGYLEQTSVLT